jgi:hypothetical protein
MTLSELISKGYRVVSRRYSILSRVDREDWREYMATKHSPWSLREGMARTKEARDGRKD